MPKPPSRSPDKPADPWSISDWLTQRLLKRESPQGKNVEEDAVLEELGRKRLVARRRRMVFIIEQDRETATLWQRVEEPHPKTGIARVWRPVQIVRASEKADLYTGAQLRVRNLQPDQVYEIPAGETRGRPRREGPDTEWDRDCFRVVEQFDEVRKARRAYLREVRVKRGVLIEELRPTHEEVSVHRETAKAKERAHEVRRLISELVELQKELGWRYGKGRLCPQCERDGRRTPLPNSWPKRKECSPRCQDRGYRLRKQRR